MRNMYWVLGMTLLKMILQNENCSWGISQRKVKISAVCSLLPYLFWLENTFETSKNFFFKRSISMCILWGKINSCKNFFFTLSKRKNMIPVSCRKMFLSVHFIYLFMYFLYKILLQSLLLHWLASRLHIKLGIS